MARVQLSAAGFYKTPKRFTGTGTAGGRSAFYYFAYGAGLRPRVSIDTLTGEYIVDRVDILHETGPLAEPRDRHRPDRGRFCPGHGLADHRGAGLGREGPPAHPRAVDLQDPARLRTARKIFNVTLADWVENGEEDRATSRRALGEPPFIAGMARAACAVGCRRQRRRPPPSALASTPRRRPNAC